MILAFNLIYCGSAQRRRTNDTNRFWLLWKHFDVLFILFSNFSFLLLLFSTNVVITPIVLWHMCVGIPLAANKQTNWQTNVMKKRIFYYHRFVFRLSHLVSFVSQIEKKCKPTTDNQQLTFGFKLQIETIFTINYSANKLV